MPIALDVVVRWFHITSAIVLIGGIIFARAVFVPEADASFASRVMPRFRPYVLAAIFALIGSGLYRLLTRPGHSSIYHALFGIKMLLAAHVFAVALLAVKKDSPRRVRLLTGTVISGLVIIAISAYLGRIY